MLHEVGIGSGEGLGSKKAVMCGKGRWMCGFDHQVLRAIDMHALSFRIIAPQDEDEVLALFVERADYRISELLPPLPLMRAGLRRAHGERGIE